LRLEIYAGRDSSPPLTRISAAKIMSEIESTYSRVFQMLPPVPTSRPEYTTYNKYKEQGNFIDLRVLCEKELSLRPDNVDAIIFLGIALYELGLGSDAINLYRTSIMEFPHRIELRGNLASLLEADGRWEQSYTAASEILYANPEHYWMYPILFRLATKMFRFSAVAEIIRNGIAHCDQVHHNDLYNMLSVISGKLDYLSNLQPPENIEMLESNDRYVLALKSMAELDAFSACVWQRFNNGERNLRVLGSLRSISWHPLANDNQYQTFAFRLIYDANSSNLEYMLALASDHLKRKHLRDVISIVDRYEINRERSGKAALLKCRAYCALQDVSGELKCMEQALEYLSVSDPIRQLFSLRLANYVGRHESKRIFEIDPPFNDFHWPSWTHRSRRRNGKPRLALCASGQMRGFRRSFQSWAPILDAFDTDIYIHTWEAGAKLRGNDEKLLSLSQIPSLKEIIEIGLVTSQTLSKTLPALDNIKNNAEILKSFYGAKEVVIENDDVFQSEFQSWWEIQTDRPAPPINQAKLWHKIHACNELISRDDYYDYDYVLRLRIDLDIYKFDIDELLHLAGDRSTIIGMYQLGPEYVGFDDSTWFGSPEVVEGAAQAWPNILRNFGADYIPAAPNVYAESVCFYQNFAAGSKMVTARRNLGNPARLPDVFEEHIIGPLLEDLLLARSERVNLAINEIISQIAARKPHNVSLRDYFESLGAHDVALTELQSLM
jgi:hypothetical protein